MTSLLVMKEYIKKFFSKNEAYIVPLLKFLLAFITLMLINGRFGYMARIDNIAVVLIFALMCSFLPMGFQLLFAALFVLLHFYALSLEIAIVALAVFLVIFLLYVRFSPKDTLVILLLPLCFLIGIPYVVPIVMGLIGSPAAIISVACGVIVYFLMAYVGDNATTFANMEAEEATTKFRMVIDGLLDNKEMIVTIAAFAITVLVVYMIRRMSIDHSWTIAIISGAMVNVVISLVGDLMFDTNLPIIGLIIGSVVSVLLAKGIQFFVLNLDYSRTEKVQFEDDEYYYYVKAVPKITVAPPTKTVKKINSQRHHVER